MASYSTDEMDILSSLLAHPGWEIIDDWRKRKAQHLTENLLRDDLTEPTRAARIQGQIEGLNELPRHLEFVRGQLQKRFKEE